MKAHLFDADGVIFDSEHAHAAAYIAYAARFGVSLSEERFMSELRGHSGEAIMYALFPHESPARIIERVDEQNELFRTEFLARVTLIPGVEAYLSALLAARMSVIVVSNGVRANLDAMLAAFALSLPRLSIEDFMQPKPDPAGYRRALEVLGVSAEESVVYEDSEVGIRAAKAVPIRTIGVASSLTETALRAVGADAVIRDFTALQIE